MRTVCPVSIHLSLTLSLAGRSCRVAFNVQTIRRVPRGPRPTVPGSSGSWSTITYRTQRASSGSVRTTGRHQTSRACTRQTPASSSTCVSSSASSSSSSSAACSPPCPVFPADFSLPRSPRPVFLLRYNKVGHFAANVFLSRCLFVPQASGHDAGFGDTSPKYDYGRMSMDASGGAGVDKVGNPMLDESDSGGDGPTGE